MSQYAKEQPKAGDLVIHCFHLDATSHHFYKGNFRYANVRPPLEDTDVPLNGQAKWLVVCDDCFNSVEGDIRKLKFGGVSFWQGDEPAILKDITH